MLIILDCQNRLLGSGPAGRNDSFIYLSVGPALLLYMGRLRRNERMFDIYDGNHAAYMKHNPKNLVFIVDDDPDDRQIILDAFLENNARMDYVFVENGEELARILSSCSDAEYPSLILLDLNMPGMLGMQVLKEIKGDPRFNHIPVIILTTSSLSSDRMNSYDLGANCFLSKPASYSELVSLTGAIARLWFAA